MGGINFFFQGLKHFKEVGTVSRSSRFAVNTICKHIDFSTAKCIIELGAGDGPISKELAKRMSADAKLIIFEINERFYEQLREYFKNDDRVMVLNEDASKLAKYIRMNGFEEVDAVVSTIPFVIIPEDTIIEEAKKYLKKGNKYIQLNYTYGARKRYGNVFGNVKTDFVVLNLPPAYIHSCIKN